MRYDEKLGIWAGDKKYQRAGGIWQVAEAMLPEGNIESKS